MKSRHAALPGLQAAAALYLARTSEAKIFCADANRTVVPEANCDNVQALKEFFVFGKDVTDIAPGTQVEPETHIYDASDVIMRQNAKYPPPSNASPPLKPRTLQSRDDWVCDTDSPDFVNVLVLGYMTRRPWWGPAGTTIGVFGRGPGSLGG
ncbi:hypothetical protein CGRA01v4_14030 [Colletotrichum graminicola]|uniref:Uncharacterized protein n=1 Tax=Colletotrichum graminicola (strain M1.001 / M2 / FGSC 10212) TaxID=645133 RepID=E3QYG3_COLGM|nr:uncharacterized protein GLRG_11092 [Colletotrichum graminicola M1.001]EFQ35901.1 hypothetical protein GLRG_11092 [Colletotrichum graminicola M1.001]WDK22740.1 hypothetical protein CGRA01v4_14030 [Colletotrichum graminicola]